MKRGVIISNKLSQILKDCSACFLSYANLRIFKLSKKSSFYIYCVCMCLCVFAYIHEPLFMCNGLRTTYGVG